MSDKEPKKKGRPPKPKQLITPKKHASGQPSKIRDDSVQDDLKLMYSMGATDEQVAQVLKIKRQTIDNWKKAHPEYFGIVKDWKTGADIKVEMSLYRRACGYEIDGKHYPPDPTSMIFWLKNRKRLEWRDKIDHEHTGDMGLTIKVVKFSDIEAE